MKPSPTSPRLNFRSISICTLALIFLLSFPEGILKANFSDVTKDDPRAKAIEEISQEKLIEGYQDNTFKPEKLMSRGDFLKAVFTDIGFKPAAKNYDPKLQDVPPNSPLAPYVQKGIELGIIAKPSGTENFYPARPMNHIDALRIAFILEGIPAPYYTDIAPEDLFQDIRANAPFAYLIRAAKQNHVVFSQNPEFFFPYKNLSRGDAAELLYQVQQIRQKNEDSAKVTVQVIEPNGLNSESGDDLTNQLLNSNKFPILLDVWKKIHTDFYGKYTTDQNALVYGAIQGMVDALNDHYTIFQEPVKAEALTNFLQGQFEGIGATLDLVNKNVVIVETLLNSPADKSGLKVGDIITKVDNTPTADLSLDKILNLIRGTAGTTVHLTIERNGTSMDFTLTREKLTIASVGSKLINNAIVYIRVNQFLETTSAEFRNAVNKALQQTNQAPKGFIIDLRGNPGGYVDIAVQMLGAFIGDNKVLTTTKTNDGIQNIYSSKGDGQLGKFPVIVLVDHDSASAAEIMAGALQDYKIAKLVGEKTYGKGSVQELLNYVDGSILKMTIAHWLTPLGRDINGIGLTPDIAVSKTATDIQNNADPQLDRAIHELQP